MILHNIRPERAADDVDLSDIIDAEQVGPAFWHQTAVDALVVPLDAEPTPDQARAIRRRLVTANPAEEAQLYRLLAAHKDPAAPEWAKAIIANELAKYGEPV